MASDVAAQEGAGVRVRLVGQVVEQQAPPGGVLDEAVEGRVVALVGLVLVGAVVEEGAERDED